LTSLLFPYTTLFRSHIARLLDGGVTEEGRPYIVIELVDGVTIDSFRRERKLGRREIVLLFQKVCEAVEFAHRNAVVHRDIEPAKDRKSTRLNSSHRT